MEWFQVIADGLLPVLAALLVATLTPLAVWLGRKLAQKLELENKAQYDSLIDSVVERAVHWSEEQARKALKADKVTQDGPTKLLAAMRFARTRLDELGWLDVGAATLRELIEAKLNIEREIAFPLPASDEGSE